MNMFISQVYAADDPPKIEGIFEIIDNVLDKVTPVAVILCVAMFIVGGYMWIVSGGNPENTKKAQGTMTWAAIGFVFIFIVKAILSVVYDFIAS
jgi:hypothetical protein